MVTQVRFPRIPSNLPPESQEWARRVEEAFSLLMERVAVLESNNRR